MQSLKPYMVPLMAAASVAVILCSTGILNRTLKREPYNPLAICSSGLGRSLSRWLTEEAEVAYHHGAEKSADPDDLSHDHDGDGHNDHAPEDHHDSEPQGESSVGATLLSRSTDRLASQLSFRAAAESGRVSLTQADIKGALERTEFWYRLAFEFDPGNYRAYDAYFFFLTTDVSNTDFARVLRPRFTPAELAARRKRAIALSQEALTAYRLGGDDAEQYLGAAMTWYNIVDLATPDPKSMKANPALRQTFIAMATPALREMGVLIEKADEAHKRNGHNLSSERQEDIRVSASNIKALHRSSVAVLNREIARSAPNQ